MFKLLKFVLMAMAALAVFVVFVRAVDTPGVMRFNRYCGYPNKDALLAAETNDVVRFDFAACMERASKDFDRFDMLSDKCGIRFRCCESAAKLVLPGKTKSRLSPTEVFSCSDMSFWDVLTNVCETAGCMYRVYDREVCLFTGSD